MKKEKKGSFLPVVLMPLVVISLVLCFLSGVSNLTKGQSQEDKRRLEDVLRESAVACYAVEGFYPPDLAYLEEHYGVQIDKRHFVVHYTAIAENLMPDITVLER
jgi:preprotein translocase subunit SecY